MRRRNPPFFNLSPVDLARMVRYKNLDTFKARGGLKGLAQGLRTDCRAGLSVCEPSERRTASSRSHASICDLAKARAAVFGTNRLPERKPRSLLKFMWLAFNDRVLLILSGVAAISLSVGLFQALNQPHPPGQTRYEWVEGVTIMAAVAIVVMFSALNDWQKEKQFLLLDRKARALFLDAREQDRTVKAIRSGKSVEISADDVAVGDVLRIEPGDFIVADGVLVSCYNIQADESSLSGETDQVQKSGGNAALKSFGFNPAAKDLDPFLVSGSKIVEGIGTYLVTAVGKHSIYGRIRMTLHERTEPTALQTKLSAVAEKIAKAGVSVAALLFLVLTIEFLLRIPGSQSTSSDHLQAFLRIVIVSLSVIVVAVPEGLPLAVTLALAIAVTRMLRDNNLVRTLAACEIMGNATVVCCDKTGTLTTNNIAVVYGRAGTKHHFELSINADANGVGSNDFLLSRDTDIEAEDVSEERLSQEACDLLVQSIAISSTAFEGSHQGRTTFIGSRTESALLSFARDRLNMQPLDDERRGIVLTEVYPFNSRRKSNAVVIPLADGKYRMLVKGAPELLLEKSGRIVADASRSLEQIDLTPRIRQTLLQSLATCGKRALRTIALAYKDLDCWPPSHMGGSTESTFEYLLRDLTFLALFGIQDPLRPGVSEAVATCQEAGLSVKMVTGDALATATAIAKECGILTDQGLVLEGPQFQQLTEIEMEDIIPRMQVLARSTPDDKTTLVKKLKEQGHIVAATGDGVNDVAALKEADVGFSMGLLGTGIAKEASDIVLLDDNFGSVVKAIERGRSVNDSIRKFLQFQLTVNITSVGVSFISAVTSKEQASILAPTQLLWLNLIMDTFGALALATDPPDPAIIKRRPDKKSTPLISVTGWKMIIGQATYQLVATLLLNFGGHRIMHHSEDSRTLQTLVFNSFVWMQIFNMFNNRRLDNKLNILKSLSQNWYFIGISLIIITGQVLIVCFGGNALSTSPLSAQQWAFSLGLGFASIPLGMVLRYIPDESLHYIFKAGVTKPRPRLNIGISWAHFKKMVIGGYCHCLSFMEKIIARGNISEGEDNERRPLLGTV